MDTEHSVDSELFFLVFNSARVTVQNVGAKAVITRVLIQSGENGSVWILVSLKNALTGPPTARFQSALQRSRWVVGSVAYSVECCAADSLTLTGTYSIEDD